MSVLFGEMTREQIRRVAPDSIAVLPTAAIEQHGPHLPVFTDSLMCELIARKAAEKAADRASVVVAPILFFGNSHHHFPFPGVMSLQSHNFMATVTDALEGLVKSGFRKVVVLNGHGGNSNPVNVVGQDLVNRLGNPVACAAGDYWNIARPALLEKNVMASGLIPGHAGRFETSLVLGVRPDLVDQEAIADMGNETQENTGLDVGLSGAMVQVHGEWQAGLGYTDNPADASPEEGKAMLEIITDSVATFYAAFSNQG
jgi:creatinine amidohydrolase